MAGSAARLLVDRATIATAVADGRIQSGTLTGADPVDVTFATITWAGIGLLVTGVLLLVGPTFVATRRHAHRRVAVGEPASDYVANSLIGAVLGPSARSSRSRRWSAADWPRTASRNRTVVRSRLVAASVGVRLSPATEARTRFLVPAYDRIYVITNFFCILDLNHYKILYNIPILSYYTV